MTSPSSYCGLALPQVPRLLGQLDREAGSRTAGSFDREHWGWKFRDFPVGTLQMAVYPLALLWRHELPGNVYHGQERLREWIVAALWHTIRRQKRNGAFEAFAPNDFDPGPTLGVVYALARTQELLGDALDADVHDALRVAIGRGAGFAARHEQTHGFVSNHWALFACAFLEAARCTGMERFGAAAEAAVDRIMEHQSADGWYAEYGGPDPGYETLGISYLSRYWRQTGHTGLHRSLARAVEFLAHCVHPDGSLGGVYGSRHDALYFPAGCETLAAELPHAASIAGFLRARLARGNVVTPLTADSQNLPVLLASYFEAALAQPVEAPALSTLPCESAALRRDFADSGITAVSTDAYYVVINAAKGGVYRAFDRRAGCLLAEDAGYLVQAGRERWISQALGLGRRLHTESQDVLEVSTQFARFDQPVPTPYNYLALRAAALTLFRSARLGTWVRDRIVGHLVARVRRAPLRLHRRFHFEDAALLVQDELVLDGAAPRVAAVTALRALTGIHMGSAKYFHPSDLQGGSDTPLPAVQEALARVGVARREQRITAGAGA